MAVLELFREALLTAEETRDHQPFTDRMAAGTVREDIDATPVNDGDGNFDYLLELDNPGWSQFLAEQGYPPTLILWFDDLVAHWLDHADYKRLLELVRTPHISTGKDKVDELFDNWINDSCGYRLIGLIKGTGYQPPIYAGAYAISNALRAVRSALSYAQREPGYLPEEIEHMVSHLKDAVPVDLEYLPKGW